MNGMSNSAVRRYQINNDSWIHVPLAGVKATIIDYTLSRCEKGNT
jgi:hypothetical protein